MLQDGKKIRDQMYLYLKDKYEGVIAPSSSVKEMMNVFNFVETKKQFEELTQFISLSKNMRILDAGCGFGYFLSFLLEKNYKCEGYEVDKKLASIARELLKVNYQNPSLVKLVDGKRLPYKDKTFDFINLCLVLDYVSDVPTLMKELVRILKDNGQIFILVPNYKCYYSAVYGLMFVPWLPKPINRLYFRLMGRSNIHFLESLTFTTPRYCRKVFAPLGIEVENLGLDSWNHLFLKKEVDDRSKFLKFLVTKSNKLRLTWVFRLLGRLGFYTPLVYVLKKKDVFIS